MKLRHLTPRRMRTMFEGKPDAIFIPMPPDAWEPVAGGCQCAVCKVDGPEKAFWDTLAVYATAPLGGEKDETWVVHYPELHDAKVRRAMRDRGVTKHPCAQHEAEIEFLQERIRQLETAAGQKP
jgi:hypothetical protein